MEPRTVDNLVSAQRLLRANLEKSRALVAALSRAGSRLDEIHLRLPVLEVAVRPIRADREALAEVGLHIDRAVGPAAAVLKVFDAVHGLERPLLSDPRADLSGYHSVLKRLEEALRFLTENSGLAVRWLDDIVDYLDDNAVTDPRFISHLKASLLSIRSTPSPLDGGLLVVALDKLEAEFRRLLSEHTIPLLMTSSSADSAAAIAPSPLPVAVISKLLAILERMAANGRLDRCIASYIDVRGSNVRASLRALGLDYLEITSADFENVQSIEGHIENWGRHLEFAVKHLFEAEYMLCNAVFEHASKEAAATCFAEIASQSGILSFLRFGKTVTEAKKDPIKLLKLLDIFASLSKLRMDFNLLFGGKAYVEIQNQTRDLIKGVVDGACEIFWELLSQVELQRQMPPPSDGAVPRLMNFITDYCNKLLSERYRAVLVDVLIIHRSWKHQKFQERLLTDAILNIVKALETNFETWSKGYEDAALSYLFKMNTHWHFVKHLKGTKLGEMLGDSWLREHEHYMEYSATLFLRESWGKLPSLLSREGLLLFSGGRATTRDLVKKLLKKFNETFDDMYQKHSNWVISENDLREKTCHSVIQAVVPVYRSFMQHYGPLVEQNASSSKYAKYTSETVEKMLGSLFQHRPKRSMSLIINHSSGKVNSMANNLYRSASTLTG